MPCCDWMLKGLTSKEPAFGPMSGDVTEEATAELRLELDRECTRLGGCREDDRLDVEPAALPEEYKGGVNALPYWLVAPGGSPSESVPRRGGLDMKPEVIEMPLTESAPKLDREGLGLEEAWP